ncbi:MAG: 1-deoxy-D-xylulose-5-phosphate synthase [Bacteroidales bacterium]|nr:1-deoxy-D-xylulose-5-phosphate synthase [Bacteroidales bacterium]MBO7232882.1 1-deoxy-D-xylulose-5-phosphate synthase [Bacteroidales bacterium]
MTENQNHLYSIYSPEDLKKLSVSELPELCQELRDFIVKSLSENPGHLAASLGTVELTVALHYSLNTPYDRIVWDVGHQAYSHKILTGRREQFHTNRKQGGLSGFPHPDESPYDSFVAGHASNSISAALGMAIAAKRKDEKRVVTAVIGDGAMSGGLAYEGLNNTVEYDNDLLIIINDNNLAIDKNVGGFHRSMARITTSRHYNNLRWYVYRQLKKMGLMNDARKNRILRFGKSLKKLFSRSTTIFDGLDIRYFGPVDGHDVKNLVRVLNTIKHMRGPKALHICTTKGKGYEPAEKNATDFHAPGKFNIATGERQHDINDGSQPIKFQDVFGHTLVELAAKNDKIVAITPAMPSGCGLNIMKEQFPDRVYDVGIAEGHAVTFSAGLAKEGLVPFCNIYSSFAQRAYDNIIHDIAIARLPVVLCLDRAGLVGEDGVTHQGAFDIAALRCIPNLTIAAPIDEVELRDMMYTAQLKADRPFVIRYPRGKGYVVNWKKEMKEIAIGKGVKLHEGKDIAIASIGPITKTALSIAEAFAKEEGMPSVAVYNFRFVKPLDEELIEEIGKNFKKIITIENACVKGGFGTAVMEALQEKGYHLQWKAMGLPDRFIEHANVAQQHTDCGIDEASIRQSILEF